ncbi:hypothetical protein QVD17_31532 [Tagetes erecta]|uniref:Neprosin PEP catalytic domain-containing protein n=1 Tax=Tagetes erecta TaxID=13708 RepID=A0AAD8K6F0_TARER|nr:hypothetical protein QVD17_31532 [Tagetes erecta]
MTKSISFYHKTSSIIFVIVSFSLLFLPIFSSKDFREENETFVTRKKLKEMKLINAHLRKINKPYVKSIKGPDGDIIDCVLFHLQPAFDRPELKGKMSLKSVPEIPKGHVGKKSEMKQLWNSNGESCPKGTIPIKRTNAAQISTSKFPNKYSRKDLPDAPSHEHAIGYVTGGEFYGAKAVLNVWEPNVTGYDFSLSQIWVISDLPNHPANSLEAGWHVNPLLHADSLPRLFNYWTPNGYQSGCYNMICPGFVQTNQNVCLGAAIDPISTYNGQQYDVAFMIWKDPKTRDWWFMVGSEVMGYWPSNLFTDLRDHATSVEYGGEVYSPNLGMHTSTQMGSGHFQDEGFAKAAYVRNLEVIDKDNKLNSVNNLSLLAEKPNCYGVRNEFSDAWGNYIYFGGPGNNPNCP